MICPNCGYQAKDTDKFCIHCATRLVPNAEAAVENAEEAVNEAEAAAEGAVDRAIEGAEEAAENAAECAGEVIEQAGEAAQEAVSEAEEAAGEIWHEAPAAPEAPAMPIVPVMPIREEPPAEPKAEPVTEHAQPCECDRLAKPLSTWGYIWRILLFSIPILSMIPLFVMAFARGINKNSKSFARAVLIMLLVLFVLAVCGAIYALVVFGGDAIVEYVSNVYHAVIGR